VPPSLSSVRTTPGITCKAPMPIVMQALPCQVHPLVRRRARFLDVPSYAMVEIVEAYKEFLPRCNARATVEQLLASVPEELLVGLWRVVLTNAAALTGKRKRGWSWSRGRKARHTEVLGLYHQEWHGDPAWIELFVDRIADGVPSMVLRLELAKSVLFGRTLFHELGHHIHARQRPEHREREEVADDWQKRLGRLHIRRRHPIARIVLWPLVRLARLLRGRTRQRRPL